MDQSMAFKRKALCKVPPFRECRAQRDENRYTMVFL
jgi:hypothetical protein